MAEKKGSIVIDTRMNYNKIQSDFKNLEKSTESLINKYNKSVDSIKSQELAIEKVKDKIANLQLLADNGVIKDTEVGQLQNLNKQLDIMTSKLSQTKDEVKQTANKINDAFNEKRFNLGGISNGVSEISTKLDKFKKRVTRLIGTVAIFNLLRSSLTSLRDKFMTLLNTNDTFSSSLNQIKANLMTAFAPIYNACLPAINSLMNALSKLTGTIAVFVSGLFGKSLDDAKNQAKGLSKALDKTSKSGEKASGSLSSLDEIELINEDSSNVGGSRAEDTGINYDGEIQYSQKLLDFLNKIKVFVLENKDLLIGLFAGILAGIAAFKIVNFIKNSEKLLKIFSGLKNASAGLIALGIGIAVAGIIFTIQSLISYLNDPSWENFGKIITGISLIIAGLAVAFGAWPVAIGGALVAVLGLIISNWDTIKGYLQGAWNWIDEKLSYLEDNFGIFGAVIGSLLRQIVKDGIGIFSGLFTGFKQILDGIITIFKGDFKKGLSTIMKGIGNMLISVLNTLILGLNTFLTPFRAAIVAIGKVTGQKFTMENIKIPTIPKLATGTVIPPRHEFAAILGDQKHGTNIEAPLDTIVDAFNISLNKRNDNNEVIDLLLELNRNIFELSKNPTILNINGREFAKATYNDFKNEDSRQQASTNIVRR
ncbi:MAG: hypothetical protein ACI31R_05355 [Bacilli bacterium]